MEYRMIFCKSCGKEMPLGLSMCPHCGEKNDRQACKNCGSPMLIKAKRCSACGAKNKRKRKGLRFIIAVIVIAAVTAAVWLNQEDILVVIQKFLPTQFFAMLY